jgi:large subunit ribosomal protein L5e
VFPLSFGISLPNSFKKQFSTYLADGVGSDDIEEIYTNAYAAIREDPTFKPTEKKKDWKAESKKFATTRLTLEQRKAKIQSRIEAFKANGGAAGEDEEENEE